MRCARERKINAKEQRRRRERVIFSASTHTHTRDPHEPKNHLQRLAGGVVLVLAVAEVGLQMGIPRARTLEHGSARRVHGWPPQKWQWPTDPERADILERLRRFGFDLWCAPFSGYVNGELLASRAD